MRQPLAWGMGFWQWQWVRWALYSAGGKKQSKTETTWCVRVHCGGHNAVKGTRIV